MANRDDGGNLRTALKMQCQPGTLNMNSRVDADFEALQIHLALIAVLHPLDDPVPGVGRNVPHPDINHGGHRKDDDAEYAEKDDPEGRRSFHRWAGTGAPSILWGCGPAVNRGRFVLHPGSRR